VTEQPDREWRTEADDEWLARHKSDNFARLRRRLRHLGMLAGPIADAELGPFGGAPRKPQLRIGGKTYATVRYAHLRHNYTVIEIDLDRCRRCGYRLREVHRIVTWRAEQRRIVGELRVCPRCQADSWMFRSRMPTTVRARSTARRTVL
jgi:hypothetical protein